MDEQDDRRWVKFNETKNIVGVELYDSYVSVKTTEWIVDKLKKSTSERFYTKFERCYVNFEVFQEMVHHYQETSNSKQQLALWFCECNITTTTMPEYLIKHIYDIVLDYHNIFYVSPTIRENISSLQHIQINRIEVPKECLNSDDIPQQVFLRFTQLRSLTLNYLNSYVPLKHLIDRIIQNNPNLTSFIVNGRDEILERTKQFVQSIQSTMQLAHETSNTHASSIQDILLAFVVPLLPYVPRWFSSQEYVKQASLCNEMFLECNKFSS